jgi:hypothetical protein
MRLRALLLGVMTALAGAGCGILHHGVEPISASWVSCEGGSCGGVTVKTDARLVSVDIARHYCAALDLFDDDIARDLGRAHRAVKVGFRYVGGEPGRNLPPDRVPLNELFYVTEVIIPASQVTAQQAQADARRVRAACRRSLHAGGVPAVQPATDLPVYSFSVQPLWHSYLLKENFAVAYTKGDLIVARDTGGGIPTGPTISQDAVDCSAAGGPPDCGGDNDD